MAAERRIETAYIWATWLKELLSGSAECEWATWFQSNHYSNSWEKVSSDFDFTAWQQKHTAYTRQVKGVWINKGYDVTSEYQNKFKMKGSQAVLSGQPDLIARKDGHGVIIDVKTGKPRTSDAFQVKTYMWAIPRVSWMHKGIKSYEGQVAYSTGEIVEVFPEEIDQLFHDEIVGLVKRVSAFEPAVKVPSYYGCRFCNITSADCPERIEENVVEVKTEEF